MANSELKNKFEEFKNRLKDTIDDLTSLEVTTFSGNFSMTFDDVLDANTNKLSTKDIISKLKAKSQGKIDLVGYTYIDFDHDAVSFVKEDLSTEEKTLVEAHKVMVESSSKARSAFINMIKELING